MRARHWLKAALSLALGLGLCIWLVQHQTLSVAQLTTLLQQLSWPWIAVVAALTWMLWWSGARKWQLLDRQLHPHLPDSAQPPLRYFLRHTAWQNWWGQFVPPSLAIILGRAAAARHLPHSNLGAGAQQAIADQAMELACLVALLPAAWFVLRGHVEVLFAGTLALAGLTLGMVMLLALRSVLPARWRTALLPLAGWSVLRVGLITLRLLAGYHALGLTLNALTVAAAVPVVAMLALLPLTPGNLGIAEWGWVGVLGSVDTDPSIAALYAIGFRLLILVVQTLLLIPAARGR